MLFMSAGHSLQGHPSTLSTVAGDRWREVLRLRAIISRNCFVYPYATSLIACMRVDCGSPMQKD